MKRNLIVILVMLLVMATLSGSGCVLFDACFYEFDDDEYSTKVLYTDDEKIVFNFEYYERRSLDSHIIFGGQKVSVEVQGYYGRSCWMYIAREVEATGVVVKDECFTADRSEKNGKIVFKLRETADFFTKEFGYKKGDVITFNVAEFDDWFATHPEDEVKDFSLEQYKDMVLYTADGSFAFSLTENVGEYNSFFVYHGEKIFGKMEKTAENSAYQKYEFTCHVVFENPHMERDICYIKANISEMNGKLYLKNITDYGNLGIFGDKKEVELLAGDYSKWNDMIL